MNSQRDLSNEKKITSIKINKIPRCALSPSKRSKPSFHSNILIPK